MISPVTIDHECIYNTSPEKFVITKPLTSRLLEAVMDRFDCYHFEMLTERLTKIDPSTGLPILVSFNANTKPPTFNWVKRSAVANVLGMSANSSIEELCAEYLQQDFGSTNRELLGRTMAELIDRLSPKVVNNRIQWQDVRRPISLLIQSCESENFEGVVERLVAMSTLDEVGLRTANAYLLLVALYAERALLHPLSFWRGVFPGSQPHNAQKFMEVEFVASLVGPEMARDVRAVGDRVDREIAERHRPGTNRFLNCLMLTSFERPQDYDCATLVAAVTLYLEHENFRQRNDNVRWDTREFITRGFSILSGVLVAAGRPEGAILAKKESVSNGITIRKNSLESKSSGTFQYLLNAQWDLSGWPKLLSEYIDNAGVLRKTSILHPISAFCTWLEEHGDGLSSPFELTRSDVVRTQSSSREVVLVEYLTKRYGLDSAAPSRIFGGVKLFYGWLVAKNEFSFVNPLFDADQPPTPAYAGKTSKESLPAKIIEAMKEILIEDDWGWPRGLSEDYVVERDLMTGDATLRWSPVRAVALYTLLSIPLRSIQVRLLDSGEFDEKEFDYEKWAFEKNSQGIKGNYILE